MARRKKEPEGFHRRQIAAAAGRLFEANGVVSTTMDEIAREAGYSKATLYVYFQNKEEVVAELTLESMKRLHRRIQSAVSRGLETREAYGELCRELAEYQREEPLYFEFALKEIRPEPERPECLPVKQETFQVGEQINGEIARFLRDGIARGDLRPDLDILPTVLIFWGSLSGLILLAAAKQAYLEAAAGQTRETFLDAGFALLYRAIERRKLQ